MNLPNKLTVLRMIIVPIIVVLYLLPYTSLDVDFFVIHVLGSSIDFIHLAVAVLFILASVTDFIDGKLARSRNLVTTFGKFMDPIADKLLVNSLLILLAYDRSIPVLCTLLMIARDLIVDAIRLLAAQNQHVLAASPLGKAKTMTQMIGIGCVLLCNFPFAWTGILVDVGLIILATVISVISGVDYFMKNRHLIVESI